MKKSARIILFLTAVSAASATILAQSFAEHTPRDGDRLHPGFADSHSLILLINDTSRTVLVDPSAISFDDDRDASAYLDGDTISYVQAAIKHRFIHRGDTLSYIGYENRATDFRLDTPTTVAVFPLKEGDAVVDGWTGHVLQYGTMMLKHIKGISRGEVQDGWTLTDGNDTLRNVTRLRWTLDMAYADTDSVTPEMADSVASDIISEMHVDPKSMLSERLLSERTMWFSEDARYPVLTDTRISRILLDTQGISPDTVPLTAFAIHYPPAFQYSDTGEDFIARKPDEGRGSFGTYGYEEVAEGTSLRVGEPEVGGGTLSVTLSSPYGIIKATVTLFSDNGIRLTEATEIIIGTVPQTCALPVPTGCSGVVLLRVDAGEESYTRKAML